MIILVIGKLKFNYSYTKSSNENDDLVMVNYESPKTNIRQNEEKIQVLSPNISKGEPCQSQRKWSRKRDRFDTTFTRNKE